MTTNYIMTGDVIEAAAPSGGITAGVGLMVGTALFGVALNTAAEGATVQLKTSGIFTMAKTSALAIAVGDVLYWDATNKVVNKTTSGQRAIGVAYSAASNPSASVQVRLGVDTQPGT
jgi:predicted RecA/RadA family phage recombinase